MKSRSSFSRIASAIKVRLTSLALYIFAGTSLKRLRLRCLKLAGADISRDVTIRKNCEVRNPERVKIQAKVSKTKYLKVQGEFGKIISVGRGELCFLGV